MGRCTCGSPDPAVRGTIVHLECSRCGTEHDADRLQTVCTADGCGKPLFARYDLDAVGADDVIDAGRPGLWRYAALLPDVEPAFLGEGGTPLLAAPVVSEELGVEVLVKDEGANPTGTFKDRGQAVAVPMAKRLGATGVTLPTAGNAGAACAAYAARAGLPCRVFTPEDAPTDIVQRMRAYGAEVTLVDGLIDACGKEARSFVADRPGWFDVSTLKEPYRVEGKKTMGFEVVEALGWEVPDAFVYPTGGGTGIVGMWKALAELEAVGRIDGADRPRFYSVQSEGCAPVVRAVEEGLSHAPRWEDARTDAAGLRVPALIGDFLVLKALRGSGGGAIAVPDDAMRTAQAELGADEGISACLEGAATLAGLRALVERGDVEEGERVVLFNTGRGP